MYPPNEDDDLDLQPLDLQPISQPTPVQPQLESFRPLEDLTQAAKGFGQGLTDLGVGIGSLFFKSPVGIATEAAYNIPAQIALAKSPTKEAALIAAEQVSPVPFAPIRKIMSGQPEEVAYGIGEILPATMLAAMGLKGATLGKRPIKVGDELPIRQEPSLTKRQLRLNEDGTFTDKVTGEIIDRTGKPVISPASDVVGDLDLRPLEPPAPVRPQFVGSRRNPLLGMEETPLETPQQMQVPGTTNIAMGGASPRTLRVLGSSLYSRDLPTVVTKELLQNSFDEHAMAGTTDPVKLAFVSADKHPKFGETASITVRDHGRGMTPEQLYSVFTDVGETGKAGVEGAAGGFGFAKAAPMLGGKYIEVSSVIDEKAGGAFNRRVMYSFEGSPDELINQTKGVPLKKTVVSQDVPTGLKVKTYFDKELPIYTARNFAEEMVQSSTSVKSPIEYLDRYGPDSQIDRWLDSPTGIEPYSKERIEPSATLLPERANLELPGSKVKISYGEPVGEELTGYELGILNKGLFQTKEYGGYSSSPIPNVPAKIIADIVATVEEGHPEYPFTANREQLNVKVTKAIKEWISENLVKSALHTRTQRIQRSYDEMGVLSNLAGNKVHYYDQGGRLTPNEIVSLQNNRILRLGLSKLADVNRSILGVADTLGWAKRPSDRLKKFGILFAAPSGERGTTLGIHIPNPSNVNDSAILVNLFEHLEIASKEGNPLDKLSTGLFSTITHEQAHIPGGGHDTGFAYRHAQLLENLGRRQTNQMLDDLASPFGDLTSGKLSPEILDLLSIYRESRGRPASIDDPLLGTGISQERPANIARGAQANIRRATGGREEPPSKLREAWNVTRGILSTDLPFLTSAALRQGKGHIGSKEWFKAWIPSVAAYGSQAVYDAHLATLKAKPIFKRTIQTGPNSFQSPIERAGVRLAELGKITRREEAIRSQLAEKIPLLGRAIKASNRSYAAYLNDLRVNAFENLYNYANKMGMSPDYNDRLLRELGAYINNSTGSGELKTRLPFRQKEFSLEKHGEALAEILFSPRLIAANLQSFNPYNYFGTNKLVRQQYWKSGARMAGAWLTFASLAKLFGAEVSLDSNSADFGKIRIGDTRLDPAGGLQQFLVLASRMGTGRYTSSTTGKEFELGSSFASPTRGSVIERFAASKLHPSAKFLYDFAFATKKQPFQGADRLLQSFTPMIVQDLTELVNSGDSDLIMFAPLISAGWGTQTYSNEPREGLFISPENDITFEGGSLVPE